MVKQRFNCVLGGLTGLGKTTLTVYLCIRSGIGSRYNNFNIVFYIFQRLNTNYTEINNERVVLTMFTESGSIT